jgi:hypothetical protein
MKKVQCYKCELCEEVYEVEQEAISCEKTHVEFKKLSVIDAKYTKDQTNGFPDLLLIEIDGYSGVLAEYVVRKIDSVEGFEPYHKPIDYEF